MLTLGGGVKIYYETQPENNAGGGFHGHFFFAG